VVPSPVLFLGCGHQHKTLNTCKSAESNTAVSRDGAVPSQSSSWDRVVELKQVFRLHTTSTMRRVFPIPAMEQVMRVRRISLILGDIPNLQ